MALPQTGIFALGNLSHSYLEFDLLAGVEAAALVTAVASLTEPRTTMGGVNLVTAFRPELWSMVAPSSAPADVIGFTSPVVAADGYTMPATQHDLALWIAGGAYDVVFDAAIGMIAALSQTVELVDETVGWSYHRDLDLTAFIDSTKNPSISVAPRTVLIPERATGAGGYVFLLPKTVRDGQRGHRWTPSGRNWPSDGRRSTAWNWSTVPRRLTWPEPTRTTSAICFAAIPRSGQCGNMARCSSASAPSSGTSP